jgi:hypothetical protein
VLIVIMAVTMWGCSHGRAVRPDGESPSRLGPDVMREAVVFEAGTKDGAVVPEISAPSLHAVIVEEKIEGNRLIERHREWILEGEVQLLGIPKDSKNTSKAAGESHQGSPEPAKKGGSHEN